MNSSDMPTTTLTIRKIDPRLKERLRLRAATHGRSMEAELRAILIAAIYGDRTEEPNLAHAIRRRFAPLGGVELEPHPAVQLDEPPLFDP
jgi:plasmid stability protein